MSDVARDSIEAFAFFAHRLDEQHRAIAPAAKLPGGFEPNGELRQLGREAQLVERTDHIGGNYDSGSDFMQLARLLVDGYVDIRFAQKPGCREAPEPAPLRQWRRAMSSRPSSRSAARPSRQRRGATGSFPTISDLAARLPPRQT